MKGKDIMRIMRGVRGGGLVLLLLPMLQLLVLAAGQQQSYIVYMGGHSAAAGEISPTAHHQKLTSLLGRFSYMQANTESAEMFAYKAWVEITVKEEDDFMFGVTDVHRSWAHIKISSSAAAAESLLYSYQNFNSFAAKLTQEQAAALAGHNDVVSVFPNKANQLHTTHSWAFLGLEDQYGNVPTDSLWTKSGYGKDVIIGLLDTGVWPESASYNDSAVGPIPANWKGECSVGEMFGPSYCNRKLIGGRWFIKGFEAAEGPLNTTATGDFLSARDSDGHGTHTSTTAGGSYSADVSCLGFAPGTAKGGAPLARIAMYKVCWPSSLGNGGCYDADILAGLDQGISDGVHLFSISLGSAPPLPSFFQDGLSIGSFHASQFNISVVLSAGNSGPGEGSVANVAPWMTTVAAGSVDRDFASDATLGNNISIHGESLSQDKLNDTFYPLVSSTNIPSTSSNSTNSALCFLDSLDPVQAKGNIVVCLRGVTARIQKGQAVKLAGGVGMILANDILSGDELISDPHVLPATQITYSDGVKVYSYMNSTTSPVAKLSPATTLLGTKPAPVLAAFSSEGPNTLVADILKPDIAAPGMNILAAYTQATSVTGLPGDTRIVQYNIISGTSMSCPHVAGATASLKAYHPTWTPAALRSALVTTAFQDDNMHETILNSTAGPINPFGVGGGYLNPNSAAEPGLVYDAEPADFFTFLCSVGYTMSEISTISGKNYTCPKQAPAVSDFNYPSLTVSALVKSVTVKRTVTNVGIATSTYKVSIIEPPGIGTTISPSTLQFSALGQKITFTVTLSAVSSTNGFSFGSYTWSDGTHSVRSPMVVQTAQ